MHQVRMDHEAQIPVGTPKVGVLAKCVIGSEFRAFSNLRHFFQRGCMILNAFLHNLDNVPMRSHIGMQMTCS